MTTVAITLGPATSGMEALGEPDATVAPLTVMRAVAFVSVGFTVMVAVALGTLTV